MEIHDQVADAGRLRPRLLIALILATVIAYLPAIRAPFEFDDFTSIPQNGTIRTLAPSIALHPPAHASVTGRPTVNYSLAVNYAINQWLGVAPGSANEPVSYRVANLLLHITCGLLLFGIVRRTLSASPFADQWATKSATLAAMVAALWLLHPIQTDAVNYVIQRTELLVSLCYLGVLYAAIRAWDAGSQRAADAWRTLVVTACLAGLGSKEVMVTAPAMVVLYDRAFRLHSWKEIVTGRQRTWFYAVLTACSVGATWFYAAEMRSGTAGFRAGMPWYRYLYSQAWAIPHYLRLVIWPNALTFDYGQKPIADWRGAPGSIVLGALVVLSVMAWTRVQRWGWAGFLGAWFFLVLAPSSSVVPIITEIAAERRVYLALASVMVLLVIVGEVAYRRLTRRWSSQLPRVVARLALTMLLAAMAATTFARSRTYRSSEALWRDATRTAPENPRAYANLAATIQRQPGRGPEAAGLYAKAIVVDSTFLPAWTHLALIKVDEGQQEEAVALLQHVLRINPDYADGLNQLAKLYVNLGEPARAVPCMERLATVYPTAGVFFVLGQTYLRAGRDGDAQAAFRRAVALNPALAALVSANAGD